MHRFLIILNIFNLTPILTTTTCMVDTSFRRKINVENINNMRVEFKVLRNQYWPSVDIIWTTSPGNIDL